MEITELPRETRPVAPPFNPHARERIKQVATALLDLVGRLEERLVMNEQRIRDLEDAVRELEMVPRG